MKIQAREMWQGEGENLFAFDRRLVWNVLPKLMGYEMET